MRTLLITHFRSDNSPTPRSRLLGGRRLWTGAVAVFVLMCFLGPVASQAWAGAKDDYANARQGMVETIAALAVLTEREVGRRALDTAVTKKQRVALERMLIRVFASVLPNKREVPTMGISVTS